MTQTFSTKANNDIFINNKGLLDVSTGQYAVGYACKTAAQAQRGEMVLSINSGIPNFQITWAGSPNLSLFEAFLKETLQNVNGVVEISELTTKNENNVLSYDAVIKTIYGNTTISG